MLASNDNQLTLHMKIIFREYSQISTSYYTSLSEKFQKKKSQNLYNYLYSDQKLNKHIHQICKSK